MLSYVMSLRSFVSLIFISFMLLSPLHWAQLESRSVSLFGIHSFVSPNEFMGHKILCKRESYYSPCYFIRMHILYALFTLSILIDNYCPARGVRRPASKLLGIINRWSFQTILILVPKEKCFTECDIRSEDK